MLWIVAYLAIGAATTVFAVTQLSWVENITFKKKVASVVVTFLCWPIFWGASVVCGWGER